MTTTTTVTSFPYYQLANSKVFSWIYSIKQMVNVSLYTVELCMHLRVVLEGLPISKELKVRFIDIISMLNGNMKHTHAIAFE